MIALLSISVIFHKIGRPEQGRAELSTAIELYRAMDMTFWLPQAEVGLTQAGSSLVLPMHREP